MNKPVYLGSVILDLIKIEFWYDYIKEKFADKAKLCYIKTEDFYKNIKDYVKTRFDTSNYKTERALPIGKKFKK